MPHLDERRKGKGMGTREWIALRRVEGFQEKWGRGMAGAKLRCFYNICGSV